MENPLNGKKVWACSMNESHMAMAKTGLVHVFTAEPDPQLVTKLDTCEEFISPKSILMGQPIGNRVWARCREDVVLYEDGTVKGTVSFGATVNCFKVSKDGTTVWVGTRRGKIFKCVLPSGKVTELPVRLDGEHINQIEEAEDKCLVVFSGDTNYVEKSHLTVVSTEDMTKTRVFPVRAWISYFDVVNGNEVLFGSTNKIKWVKL